MPDDAGAHDRFPRAGMTGVLRRLGAACCGMGLGLFVLGMLAPLVVIVTMSFAADAIPVFPPHRWGLDQYAAFLTSPYWLGALQLSLLVALPSAALAVLAGVPAVLALRGSTLPWRHLALAVGASPLVIPSVAYALAVYILYLDLHLVGTMIGVVLIDAVLALPYVLFIVGSSYDRIPRDLELVAMGLGASSARAVIGITLRLMLPAIAAAFLFSFIQAFDDAVFINFVGGGALITLQKAIYDTLQVSMAPLINAVATLLLLATGCVLSVAAYARGSTPGGGRNLPAA